MPNMLIDDWHPGMHAEMSPGGLAPGAVTDLINAVILPGKGICTYNPISGNLYSTIQDKIMSWAKYGDEIWFIVENISQSEESTNVISCLYRFLPSGVIQSLSPLIDSNIVRDMRYTSWSCCAYGDYLVFTAGARHNRANEALTANWHIRRKASSEGFRYAAYDGSIVTGAIVDSTGIEIDVVPYIETPYNELSLEHEYADVASRPMSAALPVGAVISVRLVAVDDDGREYNISQKSLNMFVTEESSPNIGSCRAIKIKIPKTITLPAQCNAIRYYRTIPGSSQYILAAEWPSPKANDAAFFEKSFLGRVRTWYDSEKPDPMGMPPAVKAGINIFYDEPPLSKGGCPMVSGMFNPLAAWPEEHASDKYSKWRSNGQLPLHDQANPSNEDLNLPLGKFPLSGMVPCIGWWSYPTIRPEYGFSNSTDPSYFENPIGIACLGRNAMYSSTPYKRGMYRHPFESFIRWLGSMCAHGAMVWNGKLSYLLGTNVGGNLSVPHRDAVIGDATTASMFNFNHTFYIADDQDDPYAPSLDYAGLIVANGLGDAGNEPCGLVVKIDDGPHQIQLPLRSIRTMNYYEKNPLTRSLSETELGNVTAYIWEDPYTSIDDQGHAVCVYGRFLESWFDYWNFNGDDRRKAPQLCSQNIVVGMVDGAAFDGGPVDKFFFAIPSVGPSSVPQQLLTLYWCKSDITQGELAEFNSTGTNGFFDVCSVHQDESIFINFESATYNRHDTSSSDIRVVPIDQTGSKVVIECSVTSHSTLNDNNVDHVNNVSGTVDVHSNIGANASGTVTFIADQTVRGSFRAIIEISNAARFNGNEMRVPGFYGITLRIEQHLHYTAYNQGGAAFNVYHYIGYTIALFTPAVNRLYGDTHSIYPDNQPRYAELVGERLVASRPVAEIMHPPVDLPLSIDGNKFWFYLPGYTNPTDYNMEKDAYGLPQALMSFSQGMALGAGTSQVAVNDYLTDSVWGRCYRDSVPPTNFALNLGIIARSLPDLLGLIGTNFKIFDEHGIQIGDVFEVMGVCMTADNTHAYIASYCPPEVTGIADDVWLVAQFFQAADRDIWLVDDLQDELIGNPEWNQFDEFSDISYGFFAAMNGVKYFGNVVSEIGSSESSASFIYYSDGRTMNASGTFDRIDAGANICGLECIDGVVFVFTSTGVIGYSMDRDGNHYPVVEHRGKSVSGQNCIFKYDNKIYFVTSDGFYSIGRDGVTDLSYTNSGKFKRWVESVGVSSIMIGLDIKNSIIFINSIVRLNLADEGPLYGWCFDVKTESMFQQMLSMGLDVVAKTYTDPTISLGGIVSDTQEPANGLISPIYVDDECFAVISNKSEGMRRFFYTTTALGDPVTVLDKSYVIKQALKIDHDDLVKVLRSYAIKIPYGSGNVVSLYLVSDMYPSDPVSVSFPDQNGLIHEMISGRFHFRTLTIAIKSSLPSGLQKFAEFIMFDSEPIGSGGVGQSKIDVVNGFYWR